MQVRDAICLIVFLGLTADRGHSQRHSATDREIMSGTQGRLHLPRTDSRLVFPAIKHLVSPFPCHLVLYSHPVTQGKGNTSMAGHCTACQHLMESPITLICPGLGSCTGTSTISTPASGPLMSW